MEKILECRIEFHNNLIQRITVLVDFTPKDLKPFSDVRAIFATTTVRPGYTYIHQNAVLSPALLQHVAAMGMETVDRDEIFINWKNKYNANKEKTNTKKSER